MQRKNSVPETRCEPRTADHHCIDGRRIIVSPPDHTTPLGSNTHYWGWYRTVQGLEIAATVFVLTALVTGLMRVNLGHNIWQTACGLCAFAAGIFSVAGSVVYGKNYTDFSNVTLSWAYVFNVVSGSMTLASGPIMVVDAIVYSH
ncbi:uncharacterized protein LOC112563291 isoform X2 [Pomacea canaliculata]|uniref:uncharacterized protein LOC112563291 isoform X2 n=1 Tax=Pomacea canaliculata TaxID=400727 RepID=UPI000D73519F|nr:uncharacterized protein LOC112563291 isoform X2 [Pomacea canaliculata]